jgi:hypothetical protein
MAIWCEIYQGIYLEKSAGVWYLYVGIANLAVTAVMHTHFIIENILGRPAKLLIVCDSQRLTVCDWCSRHP